ncbi:MAG: hypothetical protein U0667_15440 [Chloroflexota bacterium]
MSEVELFLIRHWDGTPEDLAACVSVLQEEARRPLEEALEEIEARLASWVTSTRAEGRDAVRSALVIAREALRARGAMSGRLAAVLAGALHDSHVSSAFLPQQQLADAERIVAAIPEPEREARWRSGCCWRTSWRPPRGLEYTVELKPVEPDFSTSDGTGVGASIAAPEWWEAVMTTATSTCASAMARASTPPRPPPPGTAGGP